MTGSQLDETAVRRWVDAYLAAWRTNDRAQVEALFSPDATYRTRPDAEPAQGQAAIAELWLEIGDEPGTWTSELAPLLVHEDTAVITGWTDYADGERYSNLWIARFDADGRCADFTEWWMPLQG